MDCMLDFLIESASRAGVRILTVDKVGVPSFVCIVALPLPDGTVEGFRLAVWETDGTVVVAEQYRGSRLPRFCPERHINNGGVFCLGWGKTAPPLPASVETGAEWWENLRGFLALQQEAEELGSWRDGCSWSHGAAAECDAVIEETTKLVAPEVLEQARGCRPKTRRGITDRLENRRQPCVCGSGRRLLDCHERAIALVLSARRERAARLQTFWAAAEGAKCCGTMTGCPLLGGLTAAL